MAGRIRKWDRWATAFLLVLIMILGAWFRFPGLGDRGLWDDEINLAETAVLSSVFDTIDAVQVPHSVGYPVFLHYWSKIGDNEALLRLPSALFGLLAIYLLFEVVRLIAESRVKFLPALLLALSPTHVRFSRELAPYAPQTAILLGAVLVWLLAIRNKGWKPWVAYSLLAALSHYTHPLASTTTVGLFLLAPLVWVCGIPKAKGSSYVAHKRGFDLRPWLASLALFGLLVYPQVLRNLDGAKINVGAAAVPVGFVDLFRELGKVLGGAWTPYSFLIPLLMAPFILFGGYVLFRRSFVLGLAILGWAAGTVAIWFVFRRAQTHHFDYHYFVSHLPAFLILFSIGFSETAHTRLWKKRKIGFGKLFAIAIAIIVALIGISCLATQTESRKRNWPEYREAGAFLTERVGENDRFYIKPEYWMNNKILYYCRDIADREVPVDVFFEEDLQEQIDEAGGILYVVTRQPLKPGSLYDREKFNGVVVNWGRSNTAKPLDYRETFYRTLNSAATRQPLDLYHEAVRLEKAGRLDIAAELIEESAQLAPHRWIIQYEKGKILAGLGRHVEAIPAYEAAIEAVPANRRWWMMADLALSIGETGDRERAVAILEAAENEENPHRIYLHERIGEQLLALDRDEDAASRFEKALELYKGDRVRALVGLGDLARKAGRIEQALEFYRRAAKIDEPESTWEEEGAVEKRIAELEGGQDL